MARTATASCNGGGVAIAAPPQCACRSVAGSAAKQSRLLTRTCSAASRLPRALGGGGGRCFLQKIPSLEDTSFATVLVVVQIGALHLLDGELAASGTRHLLVPVDDD